MSKLIDCDDTVRAWSLPEIQDESCNTTGASSNNKQVLEADLNKIRKQAYQEGFNKGRQDGRASGQQQVDEVIQSLVSVLNALAVPLQQTDAGLETELVNLAVSIAKQIVRRELKTDHGQVIAVVREALSILPSSAQNIRVYLSPEDAKFVRQVIPQNAGERHWEVVDDPVLSNGSCRVETDAAVVDASFESRIAAIAAEILGSERTDE